MAFLFTNRKGNNPVIGRIVLNGEQPCANPSEISWESLIEYESNTRSRCKNKYKGNLHDETYTQFGKITYDTLYKENLRSKDYEEFNKNLLQSKYLYLYKNRFVGIDKECLKKSKLNNLDQNFLEIIIMFSLAGAIINFFLIIAIIIGDKCFNGYNNEEDISWIFYPELIYMCFGAILFIFHLITFIFITLKSTKFNCSDEIINDKVKLYNKKFYGRQITCLCYLILCFIFFVIAFSRKYYNKKYNRNIFDVYFNKNKGERENDMTN